jgi:hypothetical protein
MLCFATKFASVLCLLECLPRAYVIKYFDILCGCCPFTADQAGSTQYNFMSARSSHWHEFLNLCALVCSDACMSAPPIAVIVSARPGEAAMLYKLLKSCDLKTLFDWLTANRCRGLYENVCDMEAHHDSMSQRSSHRQISNFLGKSCPCRRHKMHRNEGAHIGFGWQRCLADMISQRFSHVCFQLQRWEIHSGMFVCSTQRAGWLCLGATLRARLPVVDMHA